MLRLSLLILLIINVIILAACNPDQFNNVLPTVLKSPTSTFTASTAPDERQTNTPTVRSFDTKTVSYTKMIETITNTPRPSFTSTKSTRFIFTPTATPTFGFEPGVNPLTGLKVSDPSILERRPVLIKVSNFPRSVRPQNGLSFADIVFEYYIGEGVNRFLALFYGNNASRIGPIRSGRLVDVQLTEMYQGLLVYGGSDDRVNEVITDKNILGKRAFDTRIPHSCPPICGTDTHSEQGVFADSAGISILATEDGVDNTKPVLNGMVFDNNPPIVDQFSVQVGVQFSQYCRSEWRYDPGSQTYLRWNEVDDNFTMAPHTDKLTNQQISFSNIIILFANYIIYSPTLHDIEIWKNTQGQRAILFRDGLMIEGVWKTYDDTRPIQLFNKNGTSPLPLKPGNLWVVLVGMKSKIVQVGSGFWDVMFDLP